MKAGESSEIRNLSARLYGVTFQNTKVFTFSPARILSLSRKLARLTNDAQLARSEVNTAVLVKNQVFWGITTCRLADTDFSVVDAASILRVVQ